MEENIELQEMVRKMMYTLPLLVPPTLPKGVPTAISIIPSLFKLPIVAIR